MKRKFKIEQHQGILLIVVMALLSTSLGFIRSASFFVEVSAEENPELDQSFTQADAWEYFQPYWETNSELFKPTAHHIANDPAKKN